MIAEALARIVRNPRQHQAVLAMAGQGRDGDAEQVRRDPPSNGCGPNRETR